MKKSLTTVAVTVVCLPFLLGVDDCYSGSAADAVDKAAVQRQQQQYQIAQPIPSFDWSLERDITIQLYRARNEEVTTWTVWRSDTGIVEGDCPSIGYPLPYDTSLTNPLQIGWRSSQGGAGVIEQAEPNGIFASKNSTATWVRCVVDAKQVPFYIESTVTAYPYPVTVDYDTHRVRRAEGGKIGVSLKKRAK